MRACGYRCLPSLLEGASNLFHGEPLVGAHFDRGRTSPLVHIHFDRGRRAIPHSSHLCPFRCRGGVLFCGKLFLLSLVPILTEGEHSSLSRSFRQREEGCPPIFSFASVSMQGGGLSLIGILCQEGSVFVHLILMPGEETCPSSSFIHFGAKKKADHLIFDSRRGSISLSITSVSTLGPVLIHFVLEG